MILTNKLNEGQTVFLGSTRYVFGANQEKNYSDNVATQLINFFPHILEEKIITEPKKKSKKKTSKKTDILNDNFILEGDQRLLNE